MRENRKSGSEGGEAQTNELSLPLSLCRHAGPRPEAVRKRGRQAAGNPEPETRNSPYLRGHRKGMRREAMIQSRIFKGKPTLR